MKFSLLVGWFLVPVLAVEGCQNLDGVVCNETVAKLEDLFSRDFPADSAVCVDLTADEVLNYTATALNFSVVIRGNNSTVSCDNSEDLGVTDTHFPLWFSNSSQVIVAELNFEGCMRPLLFQLVKTVQIVSSKFSNFYPGGAIEISNSPLICIQDSSFDNDTSLGIGKRSFSGNAGGVAVGYNQTEHLHNINPTIVVTGCTFTDNKARAFNESYRYTVLTVLSSKVYNQRGGGMAFYFGEAEYNGRIRIENCLFANNSAEDSGGGVYMFLGGQNSSHGVNISDTNFTGNTALDGGGLEITHSNDRSLTNPNYIDVTKCRFEKNWGKFGGGYKNIQLHDLDNSNYLSVRDTLFDSNHGDVGAGIYLQSVVTVEIATLRQRITMENCVFTNNQGKRGVVFVIGNVVTIQGDTLFEKSVGPALRVLGTLVVLKGHIMFRENRHHSEGLSGSLYLSSFGQIVLNPNTNITFLNNNGSEGACIVAKGQLIAAAFTRQLYNPQCFLQYQDQRSPPHQWKVKMIFEGNRAKVGPAVLVSDGKICLWNETSNPYFSEELQDTWSFMEMRENYVNGDAISEYYIQTGIDDLNITTDYESAFPGETIKIAVTALDQFGHNTSAFIGIATSAETKGGIKNFEPSIVPLSSEDNGIEFKYFGSTADINTTVELNPFFTPERKTRIFTLHHDPCLPGYTVDTGGMCRCSETVKVILCHPRRKDGTLLEGILLADGLWGAPPYWSRELVTYPCPPGYCSCTGIDGDSDVLEGCQLLYNEPDAICNKKRKDVLCGRCMPGYGVGLLTNRCQEHRGLVHYYWLVPLYIAVLVVCLVLLVKLGVHLPTILRGFLFYIQLAPIAVAYFPSTFHLSTQIVSCVASTLALYIPYDFTFHPEMTSLESYGLRYSAPLVALIVVPLAARFRRHRFKYWHGIWTIVLLMYVMVLETSVSLLFCTTLQSANGSKIIWFFDGNVNCYAGAHIPLGIIAIITLLLQALLVLFVSATIFYKTLRIKYKKFEMLERFHLVVTHGIKHEYKWWPIVELGCRYVFVMAVVLSPGTYVVVPLVLSISIFVMQTIIHPYESKLANYTESLLFMWLVGLLALGNTTALQAQLQDDVDAEHNPKWPNALLYIPVVCGGVVLLIYLIYLIGKNISSYREKLKKLLKMNSSESVRKIRHGFSVSYSTRKQKLLSSSGSYDVTKSVIGFDDDNIERESHTESERIDELRTQIQ